MDYGVQWFYWGEVEDGEEPLMVFTKNYQEATGTQWVFTDKLDDGTEYGISVIETQVTWLPSEYIIEQVTSAMESYVAEHGP